VKIEPVREKLSCGQQRIINVHYVLNGEGYKNARYTNFYYVVSAALATKTSIFFYFLLNTTAGRNLQARQGLQITARLDGL